MVGDDVARDEGEGFADAADWRRAHVPFWDTAGTPEGAYAEVLAYIKRRLGQHAPLAEDAAAAIDLLETSVRTARRSIWPNFEQYHYASRYNNLLSLEVGR